MIQLSKTGTHLSFSPEDMAKLNDRFKSENHIKLPQLIAQEVLKTICQLLDSSSFGIRKYKGLGQDLCPEDVRIAALLNFLCNNPRLFEFVEYVTDCGPLGCFVGKVYRMVPDHNHYDSWHDDNVDDRKVALSINLTTEPYAGGILEIRDSSSKRVLHRLANIGFGDGIVFPISERLEHRRTNVKGIVPKTAFAGWFKTTPNFRELVKNTGLLNNQPTFNQ